MIEREKRNTKEKRKRRKTCQLRMDLEPVWNDIVYNEASGYSEVPSYGHGRRCFWLWPWSTRLLVIDLTRRGIDTTLTLQEQPSPPILSFKPSPSVIASGGSTEINIEVENPNVGFTLFLKNTNLVYRIK